MVFIDMDRILKLVVCAVLFSGLICPVARAQVGKWSTPADSLAAEGVPVPDSLYRGFNALQYSMQKRYRPEDEIFYKVDSSYVFGSGKLGYMFVTANFVSDHITDGNSDSFSWTKGLEFALGWRSSIYNSWRLSASYGGFNRNSDLKQFRRAGLGLEHNFYLVSYLDGFKRIRFFDLYTVLGAGTDFFFSSGTRWAFNTIGSTTLAPWVKLGIGSQFKFTERLSFTLSPQFIVYPVQGVLDNSGGVANIDKHQYNSAFSFRAGLQIDLGQCFDGQRNAQLHQLAEEGIISRSSYRTEFSLSENPTFVSVSAGAQFQNGSAMWDTTPYGDSFRETIVVSYGKWTSPVLGVRASGFHGRNIWKTIDSKVSGGVADKKKNATYEGLRAELMVDPLGAGKDTRYDLRFSVPLILGVETGIMAKRDYDYTMSRAYFGLCLGVQPRVRIFKRWSIFAEPHCTILPYSYYRVEDSKLQESGTNYWDAVFSLSLGVEFALPR